MRTKNRESHFSFVSVTVGSVSVGTPVGGPHTTRSHADTTRLLNRESRIENPHRTQSHAQKNSARQETSGVSHRADGGGLWRSGLAFAPHRESRGQENH